MPLTNPQLTTLRNHILANVTLVSVNGGAPTAINALPNGPEEDFAIAGWYNGAATPAFFVFRSIVPIDEIMSNGFVWTQVDNATVGKARIWEWMTRLGSLNPSKSNIVAGINEAWSGAGNLAQRTAIYVHCQKLASNAEKLFADTAAGPGTTITPLGVGPARAVVSGVTAADVSAARAA